MGGEAVSGQAVALKVGLAFFVKYCSGLLFRLLFF